MRSLLVLVLLAGACYPALEEHGGLSPIPSKVTDAEFAAIGGTVDAGLQLAKVPMIPRFAIDATAALAIRNVSTFGRSVDSGFMFLIGTFPTTFVGVVGHALKHPHHRCQYAGADGKTHEGWCPDT
jgi:hypothetical protein